jgi:SprT protein
MSISPPIITKEVETKILEVMDFLQKQFPNTILKLPNYSFHRLGTSAGRAFCLDNHIKLNIDYFAKYHKDMIEQTIPHEIAHVVSYQLYGYKGLGHNNYWKHVMRKMAPLGVIVSRCHTYDVKDACLRKVNKPHKYVCKCKDPVHNLTNLKHNKILRGARYTCMKCKTHLVPANSFVPENKTVFNLVQVGV